MTWTPTTRLAVKEALESFSEHFIVKSGRNDAVKQYRHLELWWAAKSVNEEACALTNPYMCLGSSENSCALAAMWELQAALFSAKQTLELILQEEKNDHSGR